MVVVIIAALPSHLSLATNALGHGGIRAGGFLAWASGSRGTLASVVMVVAIGLVATFVPLVLGLRAFRRLEP